jgi:hypothetical protein
MDGTIKTDQEDKTRLLVDEIQSMSAEILQQVAELLNATPDEKLFGDTEFKVRDQILKLVAVSFNARLAQKKTAMSAPASTVLTADDQPNSKDTASEIR